MTYIHGGNTERDILLVSRIRLHPFLRSDGGEGVWCHPLHALAQIKMAVNEAHEYTVKSICLCCAVQTQKERVLRSESNYKVIPLLSSRVYTG